MNIADSLLKADSIFSERLRAGNVMRMALGVHPI